MRMRAALVGLVWGVVAVGASAQTVVALWPHGTPEPPQTTEAEANVATKEEIANAGYPMLRLSNVTVPTLTVYRAPGSGVHAAALVFPGGSYRRLAMDIEGSDACRWLNGIGVTCVLVKYRVPEPGYYPRNVAPLEDAQQAMRLVRAHAAEWEIDAEKVGVVGSSAGGNLAVLLSTHADDAHVMSTPAAADVPMRRGKPLDARANFAVLLYPAYLQENPDPAIVQPVHPVLNPVLAPNKLTPPTFLIAAEDDKSYGRNTPVYYQALTAAGVPAEMHMYAGGGHGFGIYPAKGKPEVGWTDLATVWLRGLGVAAAKE